MPFTAAVVYDEIAHDVERLITRVVSPYVDDSNMLLHFDELQAECRAKVGVLVATGALSRCTTRTQVFAFIKTSLKNLVRTLVARHAFTEKRGGPGLRHRPNREGEALQKTVILRLDDSEACIEIGRLDDGFAHFELIDLIMNQLSDDDRRLWRELAHKNEALTKAEQRKYAHLRQRCSVLLRTGE